MKRIISGALILVLFLVSSGLTQESPKEAELLFMAKKAYEDGFYEVALGMLERFQKDFPGSVKASEARLMVGQSYFHQGRYLEALNTLESLLTDPKAASLKDALYFWIAELHFKGNNFEKAISFYQKLISDFPHSSYVPAAYYSLGWSFSQIGKYSQALVSLKSLLESFPSEPQSKDAAFKLIECLYNLKEYSELKNKIKSVIKLYANDALRLPYLYFYLAESEYYLDSLNDAARNYLKSAQTFKDEKAKDLAKLGLGWSYLKLKKYDEAGETFAEIRQGSLDKKSLDILILGQAVLMSQSNRFYEAKKLYQKLIDISGDLLIRLQAYIGKADAFYNLAEYGQSVKVYKEGLEDIAKSGNQVSGADELIDKLRYNLGLAYIKLGETKSGIAVFEDIAGKSVDPAVKAGALCQIGDIYQDSGDYLKAEEVYAKVLKQYPDSSFPDYALYQSGSSQLKRSDYIAAVASLKRLIKDYPQSKFLEDAVYSLGVAYFYKQDYGLSREVLVKFRNEFKGGRLSGQAIFMLGLSMLNLGETGEALNIFKDIPKQYPQEMELKQKAEYEIADCYYKLGQEKEAVRRFELLRVKYPDSKLTPEIMWWLGQYYYRLNNLNLAVRYFSSLAKDFPDSGLAADALYALGMVFRDENKLEQALDNFKLAINLADKGEINAEAALAVADIYFQRGESEEALSEYLKILKAYPDLGLLLFPRLAKCYYKVLDYEQAKIFFKKALELTDPREASDIQFSLAEVYEAKDELDAAIAMYLKLADIYSDNAHLSIRALLRAAKIYEDRDDFKNALGIYKRIAQDKTEESKFAQERIEWIKANIK
ncbi:MAG: tetratricopeptide repeat protein [Candidatus Omnitrophica bacterium]|nr:tetratricopeptide repeat protein [Candidatus Omnitrophota bacterium]MDD5690950.1 tetratricopeptide repeat protein [Candidatus Omnitrophota bacterium]